MSDNTFAESYKEYVRIIQLSVKVDGELENSVLVNEFINALKREHDEAVRELATTDLGDHAKLRNIQLRISMHTFMTDLIAGLVQRHKLAANNVMDMLEGMNND